MDESISKGKLEVAAIRKSVIEYQDDIIKLQTRALEILKFIRPNREYLNLFEDNLQKQRLSNIEELEVILDEIYDAQSPDGEIANRVKDLEETKRGLKNKCKEFKTQIETQTAIIEESEEEITRLRKELEETEKGTRSLEKNFKTQKTHLELKEISYEEKIKKIEEQKIEISYLKRSIKSLEKELEVAQKSDSPAVIEQERLFKTGEAVLPSESPLDRLTISPISLSEDKTKYSTIELESTVREEQIPSSTYISEYNDETIPESTYTPEYSDDIPSSTCNFRNSKENLRLSHGHSGSVVSILDEVIEAESPHPNLLDILAKRLRPLVYTTPIRTSDNIESESQEDPNIQPASNHPDTESNESLITLIMPVDFFKISKHVKDIIPRFSGDRGEENSGILDRFLSGCETLARHLTTEEQPAAVEAIKLSLEGPAYTRFKDKTYTNIRDLAKDIKIAFAKKRALQEVRQELAGCVRTFQETAYSFSSRLKALLAECEVAVDREWEDEASRLILKKECARIAAQSFINGLEDAILQQKCEPHIKDGMDKLLEVVENTQTWRRPTQNSDELNATLNRLELENVRRSLTIKCSHCNEIGHTRNNCLNRANTAYCTTCGQYGHEPGPQCQQIPKSMIMAIKSEETIKCTFCNIGGHTIETCKARLSNLYCGICEVRGHITNDFCQRPKNAAPPPPTNPPTGQSGYGNRGNASNWNQSNYRGRGRNQNRGRGRYSGQSRDRGNNRDRTDQSNHNRENQQGSNQNRSSYHERDRTPDRNRDTQSSNRRTPTPTRSREIICYHCQRPGHARYECPELYPNRSENSGRPSQG